jgi:hypothetical protein
MVIISRLFAGLAVGMFAVPAAAAPASLTVMELFQSQGCSDCPPANANVMALADRPDLLTLSFGVTYWDNLGWKDTFASPQFTARQWDYAHSLRHAEVYTPQVVVNGRADIVGRDRVALEQLIAKEANVSSPTVQVTSNSVHLGAGGNRQADIWLVRFDPRTVLVPIGRGENSGLTLPHRNVVKELVKLGKWTGQTETLPLPQARQAGLKDAVLLQEGTGGPILAAARD